MFDICVNDMHMFSDNGIKNIRDKIGDFVEKLVIDELVKES